MQNSVWKLSALAGVVVVGFLVVLQTQFGLTRTAEELQAGPKDAKPINGGSPKTPGDNDDRLFPSSHLGLAGQTEPSQGDGPAAAKPVSETTQQKKLSPQGAEPAPEKPQERTKTAALTEFPAQKDGSLDFGQASPFKKIAEAAPVSEKDSQQAGPSFGAGFDGANVKAAAATRDVKNEQSADRARQAAAGASPQISASPFGEPAKKPMSQESSDSNSNPFTAQAEKNKPDKSGGESPFGAGPGASPFSKGEQQKVLESAPAKSNDNPFGTASGPPVAPKETGEQFPKSSSSKADRFGRPDRFGTPANEPPLGAKSPGDPSAQPGPKFGNSPPQPAASTPAETTPAVNLFKESPLDAKPAPIPAKTVTSDLPTAKNGSGENRRKPEPEPKAVLQAPNRLPPSPQASRLESGESEALQGDGTFDNDAPRGPQRAQLTIEKIAPKTATLNHPFVYDIVIKNVGASTASKIVVEDRIPKGSRLTGTAPQAILSGKTLRWKLGTLASGATKKISVRIVPVSAGQIGSVATVKFVSEVAAATMIAPPKVTLKFTGPRTAKIGDSVPYKFIVTNTGTVDAKDVWIRDIVPDGLTHPAGKDIEYEIGTLKPNESKTIDLTMKAVKPGTSTNRGIVTVGKTVRIESKSAVEVEASRLVISRTGPKRRYIGRSAVYTNMVTNDSRRAVKGAKLTEVIPAGMEFVEASGGGQYDAARRLVAWDVGALNPKQSRTFRVKLMPKKTGAQNSLVRAHTPDGGVIQAKSETAIDGYELVGLDVASLDRPMEVGEKVTLKIVANNRGTAAASNVQIGLHLPSQFKLVAVRGRGKYTEKGRDVTFSPIASVAAGGKAAYEIIVQATEPGDARIGVQIQSKAMQRPLNREEAIRVVPANR